MAESMGRGALESVATIGANIEHRTSNIEHRIRHSDESPEADLETLQAGANVSHSVSELPAATRPSTLPPHEIYRHCLHEAEAPSEAHRLPGRHRTAGAPGRGPFCSLEARRSDRARQARGGRARGRRGKRGPRPHRHH